MPLIYHIAEAAVWSAARDAYRPASLETEGFIHCSDPEQVLVVANARFRGREDLLLLAIEKGRLRAVVKYENTEGGDELFPHVYGPLNLDAVVASEPLGKDEVGTFVAPPRLQKDLDEGASS